MSLQPKIDRFDKVVVPLNAFDASNLFVEPTKRKSSNLYYRGNDDIYRRLFLVLPTQFCFINPEYEYVEGQPPIRTPENEKYGEYRVTYNMTSQDTIENPSDEEKIVLSTFNQIRHAVVEYVAKNYNSMGGTYKTFGKDMDGADKLVKDMYYGSMTLVDGEKVLDPKKSLKINIKVISKKFEDKKIPAKIISKIYDGNNGDPIEFYGIVGKSSRVKPCVVVEGVFWGAKASIQVKLWECNYYPVKIDNRRLLEPDPESIINVVESSPADELDGDIVKKETPTDDGIEEIEDTQPSVAPVVVAPSTKRRIVRKVGASK